MEIFFFMLLLVAVLISLGIGLKTGNFGLTALGSILCLGLGTLVISEGITTDKVILFEIDDTNSQAPVEVTPIYEEATVNDTEVWILGNLMFWMGMVFLVVAAYFAYMSHKQKGLDVL